MSEDQTGRQQAEEEDVWIQAAEVARILGVTPRTVVRYARESRIRHKLTLGGHRRYLLADVLAADASAQQADPAGGRSNA